MKSFVYMILRLLNDINAIQKGRIKQRIGRRIAGRITGKMIGKLFK